MASVQTVNTQMKATNEKDINFLQDKKTAQLFTKNVNHTSLSSFLIIVLIAVL